MGQAESVSKQNQLQQAIRSKLIQQYSGVNIKTQDPDTSNQINGARTSEESRDTIQNNRTKAGYNLEESRKNSSDFETQREHNSSSEKIFEEHAEYANELLNAPYNLKTKFTSVLSINSKDSAIPDGQNYVNNESMNIGDIKLTEDNYIVPSTVSTNQAFEVNTESTGIYTNVPIHSVPLSDTTVKAPITLSNQSRVKELKEKFEAQSHVGAKESASKSVNAGGVQEEVGRAGLTISHKVLSRKNAVIHSLSDSEYKPDFRHIQELNASNVSPVTPLETRNSIELSSHTSKTSPAHVVSVDCTDAVPTLPVGTIKSDGINSNVCNNIKVVSQKSRNCSSEECGTKPVKRSETSNTIAKLDIPKNTPRVASLRKRFETIIGTDCLTPHHEYDVVYERNTYPIVKSKSDSYVKLKTSEDASLKKEDWRVSAEEAESIYEDFILRNSFRKSKRKSLVSPVIRRKLSLEVKDSTNRGAQHGTSLVHSKHRYIGRRSSADNPHKGAASEEVVYKDYIVQEPIREHPSLNPRTHHPTKTPPEMDFRKSRKENKRNRRKSDSSTSNLSDSSTPAGTSSKKWKKSKDKKKGKIIKDSDTGVSQQWGSMITEYQEKYVGDDEVQRKSFRGRRVNAQPVNMDGFSNVRQVFNRGMVLPVKRAPPGMSAQELESDSGVTDYSTHSWSAVHRPVGMRAHMDGLSYHNNTYIKQRGDDSFSSNGMSHDRRPVPGRMRFSSQSSQYTSDAPMSPGRSRRGLINQSNNYSEYSDVSTGHKQLGRYASNHDRSMTPDEFHHHHKARRYLSDQQSSPEAPRRMRLVKQTVSYGSDAAMSPKQMNKFRAKSLPRESFINNDVVRQQRDRSVSRERLGYDSAMRTHQSRHGAGHMVEFNTHSLDRRPQSQMQTVSRDRLSRYDAQRNMKNRSMSTDRLDFYRSDSPRSKHVEYEHDYDSSNNYRNHYHFSKKKKKKPIDLKVKKVVDNVIDEAITRLTLSPKSRRRSKSRENLSSKKSSQRNVVHTTNIYNEFIEDDSEDYNEQRVMARKAYSDIDDYRGHYNERNAYEHENRRMASHHLQSALRPQPIDNSMTTERRAWIRPVSGSGITRDGSLPPPTSAYKNYDFELSVGPSQNTHMQQYMSESEMTRSVDRRARKFPHISFGPTKAKSEENLLLETRKPALRPKPMSNLKKKEIPHVSSQYNHYESDPEDKETFDPPTLTKGMVTKIMHKLEEDLNKIPSLRANSHKKRAPLDMSHDQSVTNTWPRKMDDGTSPSKIGATLYSCPTQRDANQMFLQEQSRVSSPLQTSSPAPQYNSLRRQEPQHLETNIDHARFKLYHGDHIQVHPQVSKGVTMNPSMTVQQPHNDGPGYGAFSNEKMIVADLVEDAGQANGHFQNMMDKYDVRKVGEFYGTQPDVSMNKQQSLNFFLFNKLQTNNDEPDMQPRIKYMAKNVEYSQPGRTAKHTDVYMNEEDMSGSDTELREYLIHHKQTQTPSKTPQKPRRVKHIPVKTPKRVETTHYITQEREIERVPNEKGVREMCVQTDNEDYGMEEFVEEAQHLITRQAPEPKPRKAKQSRVQQSSYISRPVITESRHMEKYNYEFPSPPATPEQSPPASPEATIPIHMQQDPNVDYMNKLEEEYQKQHYLVPVKTEMEASEPSDDETVILETMEVEEKEQRIQMAIYEEVEFSAKRTEGGKTVTIDGKSEIPNFWEPDKFEGVVDKKKKKITQVKEINTDQEAKRSRHTQRMPAIENGDDNQQQYINGDAYPMAIQQENSVNHKRSNEMAEEVTEKIAALDKVLEDELAKDEKAADEPGVIAHKHQSYMNPDDTRTKYVKYEKMVDLPVDAENSTHEHRKVMKSRSNFIRPESKSYKEKYSYTPYKESKSWKAPTLSQRIKKVTNTYQHTPLEPMFITERGESYGRKNTINHAVRSNTDPSNVTFSQTIHGGSSSLNGLMDEVDEAPVPPPLPGHQAHSQQSEPFEHTHYEQDEEGNLLKVTERQHKLTKTVEYPDESSREILSPSRKNSQTLKLPEDSYIKMNLHEQHESRRMSESTDEGPSVYNVAGAEVTEETEIGVKPFHYQSQQRSLKVDEDQDFPKERQFLYDIKKAKLKPVPKVYKEGWGKKYGTMSTHL